VSTPALLDVNVLLALLDPMHTHHGTARMWWDAREDVLWASCPLTQNGFVRIVTRPGYQKPLPMPRAVRTLNRMLDSPNHVFWPDEISFADSTVFDHGRVVGPSQITDVYLLALAVKNGGVLATFDRSIPLSAVRGAEPRHLVVL
jgi:toxin-antitoxin system PIN domain toxin